MIGERELSDINRWHYYEGGLDNRGQVINRMIDTIDSLLKIARCAEKLVIQFTAMRDDYHGKLVRYQTLESASENWGRLSQEPLEFGPLMEALSALPPVEEKEPEK